MYQILYKDFPSSVFDVVLHKTSIIQTDWQLNFEPSINHICLALIVYCIAIKVEQTPTTVITLETKHTNRSDKR